MAFFLPLFSLGAAAFDCKMWHLLQHSLEPSALQWWVKWPRERELYIERQEIEMSLERSREPGENLWACFFFWWMKGALLQWRVLLYSDSHLGFSKLYNKRNFKWSCKIHVTNQCNLHKSTQTEQEGKVDVWVVVFFPSALLLCSWTIMYFFIYLYIYFFKENIKIKTWGPQTYSCALTVSVLLTITVCRTLIDHPGVGFGVFQGGTARSFGCCFIYSSS